MELADFFIWNGYQYFAYLGKKPTMNDGKLAKILKTFSNKELKSFAKYVRSPFFNEDEKLIIYFDMMENTVLQNGGTIDKFQVWEHVFSGQPFNDAEFRRVTSSLVKLANDFIAYRIYAKHPIVSKNNLLLAINNKDLDPYFEHTLKYANIAQKKYPFRDAGYFFNQYLLETEYNKYLEKQKKRFIATNLENEATNLDIYYLIKKLKLCCEFLNYKNVLAIEYELLLMDEILSHVKEKKYDHIPAISIYYHILLTLTEPDMEGHYSKLKKLLSEHNNKFPLEESRIMYGFAQNYCINQINHGKSNYHRELFELYKTTLKKELIYEHGNITPWSYKNIVTVGLRVYEFDWVERFIHKYKEKIAPEYRSNATTYNLARLNFSRKNFDKALVYLQKVEYNDIFYNLDSRSLLLKTYFELKEFEPLYSLIDSFRIFLRRNKLISDSHRANYLNLIRFVRKATKMTEHDNKKITKLQEEVNNSPQVADINWLQEKLAELS